MALTMAVTARWLVFLAACSVVFGQQGVPPHASTCKTTHVGGVCDAKCQEATFGALRSLQGMFQDQRKVRAGKATARWRCAHMVQPKGAPSRRGQRHAWAPRHARRAMQLVVAACTTSPLPPSGEGVPQGSRPAQRTQAVQRPPARAGARPAPAMPARCATR